MQTFPLTAPQQSEAASLQATLTAAQAAAAVPDAAVIAAQTAFSTYLATIANGFSAGPVIPVLGYLTRFVQLSSDGTEVIVWSE